MINIALRISLVVGNTSFRVETLFLGFRPPDHGVDGHQYYNEVSARRPMLEDARVTFSETHYAEIPSLG
jgi:hypothetical protein